MEDHSSIPYLTACFPIKGCRFRKNFNFVPFCRKRNDFIAFD